MDSGGVVAGKQEKKATRGICGGERGTSNYILRLSLLSRSSKASDSCYAGLGFAFAFREVVRRDSRVVAVRTKGFWRGRGDGWEKGGCGETGQYFAPYKYWCIFFFIFLLGLRRKATTSVVSPGELKDSLPTLLTNPTHTPWVLC